MFPLAEPLQFDDFPASYLLAKSGSIIVKRLAWYYLASMTCRRYQTVKQSYKGFYMLLNLPAWPATHMTLKKWSANPIFGSKLLKQGQIKPDMLVSYLSGLRSYHVDHHMPLEVFDIPRLVQIIKEGRILFPSVKSTHLPIIKNILKKIITQSIKSLEDLNINAAFKIAWAGFLRLGKITYIADKLKKNSTFMQTHTTRSDILFTEGD